MSRYEVYVTPCAWAEIKGLPGHVRQRVRRAMGALRDDPRPPASKRLNVPALGRELRRLRLDRWRLVYAITEAEQVVDVLAVRRRPPYDYRDVEALLEELG